MTDHDPASGPADPDDQPGFGAAMRELDDILGELETDDLDVDILADRVRRAAELIAVCRRRIRDVEIEVDHVVAALDGDDAEPLVDAGLAAVDPDSDLEAPGADPAG
jgi:exodeoxyribonuclease VII small subunit